MPLLCQLVNLYVIALFIRIILSWFPLSPGGPMASVYGVLHTITEPVLAPVRQVMPPLGGFDLSPIVVVIGIRILVGALGIC